VTSLRDRFARRRWSARLRRARPVLLGVAAVGVAAGLVWLVMFSTALGVRDVEVEGLETMRTDQVVAAASVESGRPLARLDVDAIESRVGALARVADVEVERSWPGTVSIRVVERTAVAVVRSGATLQALDAEGVLFRDLDREPDGLPVVELGVIDPRVRVDALAEVASVVTSLDPDLVRRVEAVEVETMDAISLRLRDQRVVHWGSAAESDQKLAVLTALLEGVDARVYDVSVPQRPTTSQTATAR